MDTERQNGKFQHKLESAKVKEVIDTSKFIDAF